MQDISNKIPDSKGQSIKLEEALARLESEVIGNGAVISEKHDSNQSLNKDLQLCLKVALKLGNDFKIDGNIGPKTKSKIQAIQVMGKISADGAAGGDTVKVLGKILRQEGMLLELVNKTNTEKISSLKPPAQTSIDLHNPIIDESSKTLAKYDFDFANATSPKARREFVKALQTELNHLRSEGNKIKTDGVLGDDTKEILEIANKTFRFKYEDTSLNKEVTELLVKNTLVIKTINNENYQQLLAREFHESRKEPLELQARTSELDQYIELEEGPTSNAIKSKAITGLQLRLSKWRVANNLPPITANGKYDDKTKQAVQDFQKTSDNLSNDGIYGSKTHLVLNQELNMDVSKKLVELAIPETLGNHISADKLKLIELVSTGRGLVRPVATDTIKVQADYELLKHLAVTESVGGHRDHLKGKDGERGAWQVMKATGKINWRQLGHNPNSFNGDNQKHSMLTARHELQKGLHRFNGDVKLTLVGFNGGPDYVREAIESARTYGLTPTYKNVMRYILRHKSVENYITNLHHANAPFSKEKA